jgi:DNA primase
VGLAQRSRGASGLVDRFRGRLMFPWADERGRVLGFGARALSAEQQPKYLNTSETDVFHKGGQVYGADLARAEAARRGAVVLVEGYTDVLALHQAGVRHVVGQQGTALTADQAKALKRLASRVVLCLDGDAAGRQAMLKAAAVLRSAADVADVRVAALPPGSDPADLVQREGAETVSALLDRAVPFARWQVEHALASGDTGSAEGREALLAEAAAVIRPLAPGILREELVRMVADRLGLNDALIAASLAAAPSRRPAPVVVAPPARTTTRPPADDPAGPGTDIDALIAADPGREGDVLAPPSASSSNPALRALDRRVEIELAFLALCIAFPVAGAARLAEADHGALFSGAVVRRAAEHLREHAGSPSAELPPDDEPLAALIAELVVRAGRLDGAEPSELDRAALVLDLARLDRDIAAARASQAPVSDLAAERQRVLGEIRKVAV